MSRFGRILLALCLWLALVGQAAAPPFEARPDDTAKDNIIKPHPGEPSGGRPDRQVPPIIAKQRDALDKLHNALSRDDPDVAEIKASLSEVIGVPLTPNLQLSALLAAAKGDPEQIALAPETPNILIQFPSNSVYQPVVDYLTAQVKTALSAKVDRNSVELLPLTFSSEAKSKLENEIPLGRRARGGFIDDIIAGDFETLDARMFSSLRGKTVVVVGHVVTVNGKPAFEIRKSDGGRRYLPFDALSQAQSLVGFNVIPLGCETGQSTAIGTATKINDVDAIDAFKNVTQKSGLSTMEELLADLSSPRIRILINLSKLSDQPVIPFDLMDEEERVIRAYPPGTAGPAGGGTPSSQPLFQTSPGGPGAGSVAGAVSRATLARSVWLTAILPSLKRWWLWVYYALVAIAVAGTLAELPIRHALPVRDRVVAAISLPLAGVSVALIIGAFLGGWPTYSPLDGGVVLAPLLGLSILLQLKGNLPDHRVAIMATAAVVVWCLVPLLTTVLVFGAERMNWLVEPSPIAFSTSRDGNQ